MFINSKKLEENFLVQTKVCVIGGGVAGISIALEFKKKGIDCVLLESGGLKSDLPTMNLYRGENVGVPYNFADGHRTRYLGGSSNCWGGWCAPFEPHDFEKRDWVSNSGWPFGLNDLVPYYERAHSILKLGKFTYDSKYWLQEINNKDISEMNFADDIVLDKISQFSPPARLGILYREELEQVQGIRVFLYANLTSLEANEHGNAITHAKVKTLNSNSFSVYAEHFVLATGGIENARLLLVSNSVQKNGLGNSNDLVGRYFMDHLRLLKGRGSLKFTKKWLNNDLYDAKYNWHNDKLKANGTSIAGQLALSPEVQKKERILNARVCFYSTFLGEYSEGSQVLVKYKEALLKKRREGLRFSRDLLSVVSSPVDVTSFLVTRFIKPRSWVKETRFQIIMEQEPTYNNRVTLGQDKDSLGIPRVKVDWQPGKLEQRTIEKTLQIVAGELKKNGIAETATVEPLFENDEWPSDLVGTWHHMGTTRIHNSPKEGVVDSNCKVHGIENLFIAGSSVFPTGAANFPTITLTALALRLSDHLASKISK